MDNVSPDSFLAQLEAIRRGGSKEDPKPHKLILLLAVLDLLDSGELVENRIVVNAPLLARFEANFRLHSTDADWCQVAPPFFHLRTAEFWHHQVKAGREVEYGQMKRVGGGLERLKANVEYAFLDAPVFAMLQNATARQSVRVGVTAMLEREIRAEESHDRLGLAFHESFSLNLPAMAQVLRVLASCDGAGGLERLSRDLLTAETQLGPNYVRAMPRYCFGAGLVDGRYRLTRLGSAALEHDRNLSTAATLWAMHYHLASPHGPGPEFWHAVTFSLLRPGDSLEADAVGRFVLEFSARSGREVKERTARSAASILLGSYSKADGLGPLGMLAQDRGGKYLVLTPTPPPLWAFGYALADYWASNWGDVTGVNLTRLAEEGGLGAIFMMGGGLINRYLGELQREGVVVVQRRTPPFQLTRNWQSPDVFLERMYGQSPQAG